MLIRRTMLGLVTALLGGCVADEIAPEASAAESGEGLASLGPLSPGERATLVFTREEEKLARDVYAALAHHDPSFVNIGESEQRHMDAVLGLLKRHRIPDPVAGRAPGEFADHALQKLHDRLVAEGSGSRLAALAVGCEIEELDLADLEDAIDEATHPDLDGVYENLARGSRNHLRTYHGKLVAAGGTYTPKHLDPATFAAIVASPRERGGGGGGGGRVRRR